MNGAHSGTYLNGVLHDECSPRGAEAQLNRRIWPHERSTASPLQVHLEVVVPCERADPPAIRVGHKILLAAFCPFEFDFRRESHTFVQSIASCSRLASSVLAQ
jgi:hypothetical protein